MLIEEAVALHRAGRFAEAERAYRTILAGNPNDPDALHFYGALRAQGGDLKGAVELIGRSLQIDPDAPQAHFHLAGALSGLGRKGEALSHYTRAVSLEPGLLQAQLGRIAVLLDLGRAPEALALCRRTSAPQNAQLANLLGRALMATKATAEALAAFDSAIACKADFADAHYHRAEALHALGRNEEALTGLARVLAMNPDFAEAHLARGNILIALDRAGDAASAIDHAITLKPDLAEAHCSSASAAIARKRWQEALQASERALALKPELHEAHLRRGQALFELRRIEEALAAFDRATALRPDIGECHNSRGGALMKLGWVEEALAASDRALALEPGSGTFLGNRANALVELDRVDEALDGFRRALVSDPASAEVYYNLGNTLMLLRQHEQALAAFDAAIALKPGWGEAQYNRGIALNEMGRKDECMAACERALVLDPDLTLAFVRHFFDKAKNCDWHGRETEVAELKRFCEQDDLVDPFAAIAAFDEPMLHLKAARSLAGPQRPHASFAARTRDRLKVAYLSPDFRDHPVAHQIVEVLEKHDRSRLELFGICLRSDQDSEIRKRIKGSFEHFHECEKLTDPALARLLERLQIDVAVDLAGWTDKGRTNALSYRPVPITVNYLGFSGTTGADYVDYIIADPQVVPPGSEGFYVEKIARLPHCFFPTDSRGRDIGPKPTRAEEGLPEDAFVFCTFNNSYKITPELFDVWMRLVRAVEGSVLWLRVEKPVARNNLRLEAERRGVDPERLVFGERAERERHLARIALADLFLDSVPYNAHTTANAALWAGLPMVTCPGRSFASRVAASMLTVFKAEELIVPDLATYENLALELARSPERLAAIRERLTRARPCNPLFDTNALCRALESAYFTMWDIHLKGQKPRGFSVNIATLAGRDSH